MGPLFAPLFTRRGENGPRFDGALVLRVLRIGTPGALALFFEVSLFAVSAIILAPLGTVMVAGHQIALNFGALVFMVPLSLSMRRPFRIERMQGAWQRGKTIGAVKTALGTFKPNEGAFVFITARAKRSQLYSVGLEPVKTVAAKKVAGQINGFFKGFQAVLQQGYLIVQGNAARLHLHVAHGASFRSACLFVFFPAIRFFIWLLTMAVPWIEYLLRLITPAQARGKSGNERSRRPCERGKQQSV
jgi:Na+-driven multidrug efflux pump